MSGHADERAIRIVIVDDHDVVREGLAAILSRREMTVVGQASDGSEAIDLVRRHHPDITLMDLRMPKMDGLAATRAIVAEFPGARIIILTTFEGEEENALVAGARAVVLKEAHRDELLSTIRNVHKAA
jgi:two-component system, NarL family, response regulator